MPPTTVERITHIVEAIASIRRAVTGHTFQSFTEDETLRRAVERLLEIISEASRHLPDHMKDSELAINWRRLADLGNWLRHAYHRTDAGLLWVMIENELDPLETFALRHTRGLER